jgi:nitrate reductase NapAB chaperone NapD
MSQQSIIAEQNINLNKLNTIYYIGSYKEGFDGGSLKRCLDWNGSFQEGAPLFKSQIYKGYYSLRTKKILEQYQTSEFFDYTAFIKTGKQEFDSYIKGAVKDQKGMGQLTLLLQEKLLDQITLLGAMNRKALLDEVLDLGLPANSVKSLDLLYQMFESRVRLQLFDQMADINKQKLQRLNLQIGIVITAEKSGKLLLQNKDIKSMDNVVQIINVLEEKESYRGLSLLNELYAKQNYKLVFKEDDGGSHEIELEKAIYAIHLDENNYIHIDLDKLFADEQQISKDSAQANPINSTISYDETNQLKELEQLYSQKTKDAREIVKELNRYSIYLELKDKKIGNLYTKGFEASQKTWKKNLDNKLNTFGIGGMADFIAYIKQFELSDRNLSKHVEIRALIAKFRNSDIQFRTTEESSIWLTDMMFKIRLMK